MPQFGAVVMLQSKAASHANTQGRIYSLISRNKD